MLSTLDSFFIAISEEKAQSLIQEIRTLIARNRANCSEYPTLLELNDMLVTFFTMGDD